MLGMKGLQKEFASGGMSERSKERDFKAILGKGRR